MYRVYRGLFESREINIKSWVKSQEDHAKNLDFQTAKSNKKPSDRKNELQHLEYERQHQRLLAAQDGYFERLKKLQKAREVEKQRQLDLQNEAVADRVPQLPASPVDQPDSENANAEGQTSDSQLVAAMNRMELGPWPDDDQLDVVDQAMEAAQVERMVRVGEIHNAIASAHQVRQQQELQQRPTAPTFPTYLEAHHVTRYSKAGQHCQ